MNFTVKPFISIEQASHFTDAFGQDSIIAKSVWRIRRRAIKRDRVFFFFAIEQNFLRVPLLSNFRMFPA